MKRILLIVALAVVGRAQVALETVTGGLSSPVAIAHAGDERLFIVEQIGRIRIFDGQQLLATPFLDIDPIVSAGSERGLLGLAFHPNYAVNGFFYVDYTDNSGDTVIARYQVSANPDVADSGSQQVLLNVDQPNSNHNGGQVAFGPDGYLYIALGDGGGGGDPDCTGQDTSRLLGKILRIDVDSGSPYGIPADNPFVGVIGAREEIWAWGMRNTWRFSFDRMTGDLYLADVGQGAREEVNFEPAGDPGGRNYGWNITEGFNCFGCGICAGPCDCNDPGLTDPVLDYTHSGSPFRCSITGGYVYRGQLVPDLFGDYIFGDYCAGEVYRTTPGVWTRVNSGINVSQNTLKTFGEDNCGELYVTNGGSIQRFVSDQILDYLPGWNDSAYDTCTTPRVDLPRLVDLVNTL